ncbi:NAD-dependent epimerase/dehydratase family protein [Sphingobacterium sp.]|uniref:NAD-dependent epimerase/dehydratase family protein n=1 Tax=Sphingobacterium sp. TaxID=341027 RepID=UPI0028A124D0|nr:NAD-dependent epimerase/dehydratase family protein [Sphingobacterium sp.]
MNVIITGASGFVGQNLTKYLIENEHRVQSLSLRNDNWINQFDNKADAIIHLAGKAHDTANTSHDQEYFDVNYYLTVNLFEEFIKSDIKDFFYFSSVKAVADSVDTIVREDITGNPLTAYGKSKYQAEQYLLGNKLIEGKRLFIIRPCMIHGPGNKGNLNLLFNVVKKGIPWPLASFHNERSFLSVDNLSFLIKAMLETKDLDSGIYNFADDESLSTNELVTLISETLGKKPRLSAIPSAFIKALVKVGDFLPLPLNSERLKKLTESYVVSNEKIKQGLYLEQLPISAKEGLKHTIQSFIK